MEALQTVWTLFLIFSLFAVPQLVGYLAYFRVRRCDFVAHLVGFLIPPLLFFFLAMAIIIAPATRAAGARGEAVCGTFTGIMTLAILFGAGLQALFSLSAQLALHASHRGAGAASE